MQSSRTWSTDSVSAPQLHEGLSKIPILCKWSLSRVESYLNLKSLFSVILSVWSIWSVSDGGYKWEELPAFITLFPLSFQTERMPRWISFLASLADERVSLTWSVSALLKAARAAFYSSEIVLVEGSFCLSCRSMSGPGTRCSEYQLPADWLIMFPPKLHSWQGNDGPPSDNCGRNVELRVQNTRGTGGTLLSCISLGLRGLQKRFTY